MLQITTASGDIASVASAVGLMIFRDLRTYPLIDQKKSRFPIGNAKYLR